MNVDQDNKKNADDEFDFSQLFIAIWKHKIIIICITLIATILSGIYSVFILSPVYNSDLEIVINLPETYTTKYGDYILPITTNQQYINLIKSNNVLENTIKDMGYTSEKAFLENLRDRISITNTVANADVKQNCFEVKVSSDNPAEAAKLASTLYDNYIEFLDVMTMENVVSFYSEQFTTEINQLEVKIESNTELLKANEELLTSISPTINHEEAVQEIKDKIGSNDVIILDDVTNPNYTKVENDIITIKQTMKIDENTIEINKRYLEEFKAEKEVINKYYEIGSLGSEIKKSSIVKTIVSLPSSPVVPSRKAGPSNVKNVMIGAFLGVVIGCLIAIIKSYWIKWIKSLN